MSERGQCISFGEMSAREAAERLANNLEAVGCEVDRTWVEYRVLMFRRESRRWTQVHEALKQKRFRVSGPEKGLAFGLGAFKGL